MDRDGGGGSAGTMVGRRPRIYTRGRRRARSLVAMVRIWFWECGEVEWQAWERLHKW